MIAFWQNGYSRTSMSDLAKMSGMAKPGLYATFGDKEVLFERALLHYFQTYGGPIFGRLQEAGKHVVDDLRDFLGAVVCLTLDPCTPAGCFLVNAIVDCTYGPERLRDIVLGLKDARYNAIRNRLVKAVADGDISADADIDRAATFVDGQFSAIALLGRGGGTDAELRMFIETGLRVLPVVNRPQMFGEAGLETSTSPR